MRRMPGGSPGPAGERVNVLYRRVQVERKRGDSLGSVRIWTRPLAAAGARTGGERALVKDVDREALLVMQRRNDR